MKANSSIHRGFTLLEVLLVMVIVSSILLMIMTYVTAKTDESRRDVAVMQYQQILNAGLAFYVNNSNWPDNIDQLKAERYLPNKTITTPWRGNYTFYKDLTAGTFSICTEITLTRNTEANILASRLPLAYVTTTCPPNPDGTVQAPNPVACDAGTCAVVSTVNIPGQNLNNARSINFAGLYHNGACVPAPVCPTPSMKPVIFVTPAAVSGNFEGNNIVYPISSFTAYAVGDDNREPVTVPKTCTGAFPTKPCDLENKNDGLLTTGQYWRVCLDIVTEKGRIQKGVNSVWTKESGTVMAITRCVPNKEPSGSAFTVFQDF